jgi:polyhydroxybutyrate depolymerase
MKRFLIRATAFVVMMGLVAWGVAACSSPDGRNAAATGAAPAVRPASAATPTVLPASVAGSMVVSKVAAMKVGPLTRNWVTFRPTAKLPASAPIIVELSGIGNTVSTESTRNHLLPYVAADKAELVYPVAVKQSWNAGGCCGAAGKLGINDIGFLEKLVPRIDPGHKRPIYFVGYSNGGRMLYSLECADPGLFDGMAAVKADPVPGCVVSKPQTVLVISALDDPAVPYKPGVKGRENPPAAVQIIRLQKALGCTSKSVSAEHGDMTLTTWSSCKDGKRLGWAVYAIGGHNFPPPTAHSPSGSQIIWSFFTKTALAPLPT